MDPRPPRRLDGQFVISGIATASDPPSSYARRERLNTLVVDFYEPQRLVRVFTSSGNLLGALLGLPVDLESSRIIEGEVLGEMTPDDDIDGFVEAHIHNAFAGRFVFILDHGEHRRVYLDADGALSAVFDPERRQVASTAGVLLEPHAYAVRFRRDLFDDLHVMRDGWFPAEITAHHGVHRILCNHYLDLATWRLIRHWPPSNITPADDPDQACRTIVGAARATIDAIRAAGSISMALTAGHETRLLLAICRDMTDVIDLVTVDAKASRLDKVRAVELAQRFGLRHHLLTERRATPEEAEEWVARSGHCIGGPNMWSHPSIRPLEQRDFFIGGLGGEIGRGFLWRPTDTMTTAITVEGLISRFGMQRHPEVEEAVRAWLPSVTQFDPFLQLDLAYLELRMCCWAFAQAYASPAVNHIHPLISRRSFAAMLSLPVEWRRTNRMVTRSIELTWPELLELPINEYGDWRDVQQLVLRAARHPHLVLKRLRKRFG
jgi:hypothetical protein